MRASHALPTLESTHALAQTLAVRFAPGDVIALKGDLGAGKTSFARFFIQALAGKEIDVASPTFTLLQTYTTPVGEVWHYDLYRIENEAELAELAFEEATAHLVLIEWPERLGTYGLPITATLHFVIHPDGSRTVTVDTTKDIA